MDVKKIPIDVQCLLSASAKINNFKRAVEELVYNSLDAESTCIAIRIHIQNNWIQVVDNGIGIKKADYKLLGERYATSKLPDAKALKAVPSKYGYRGQALANIIEVSQTVTITSRCGNAEDTWVKTFLQGKTARECLEAPMRPSKGTTVEINGFLYNLKIQNKYINVFNELQDIKAFLEQLLLVFNNVSISLRDDSENEIIFKMHKNRDIYQILKSLFEIDANNVQELQVEKNEYKVKAFIGVEKKGIKNCHWIYLNNKFVCDSNVHKMINNKFSKSSSFVRHKKIKYAGSYNRNEENSVIPFYFLFLTCPYYDYDIVSSGKETTIEFKDWIQIDKLLEKLAKFYNGDMNLIKLQHNNDKKQVPENTKNEVKKLMEKFLGKSNKTARLSQMQNGIKGKQVRRRRKKRKMNIPLKKILPKNNTLLKYQENLGKIKLPNIKSINKAASKDCITNVQQKQIKLSSKNRSRNNSSREKIYSAFLKCKCNKKYDNLIEIFKNETHSIKRRCNKLSREIKDFMNIKTCEELKNMPITDNKNKSPVIERETVKYNVKKSFRSINNPATEKIRSYDLLKTVIKTQSLYEQESGKELNKSDIQQKCYTESHYYGPKLTFESHNYKNYNTTLIKKKWPTNVNFISKKSKDNFSISADKHENHIPIKTGRITKIQNKKKYGTSTFSKLFSKCNKNGLQTPFSIDMSDADIIEFSKQIRNEVMNEMTSLLHNEDCNKMDSSKSQLNFGLTLNIEKTYTILIDSLYNSSQAVSTHKSLKKNVEETVSQSNVNCRDDSPVVFTSEPQNNSKPNFDEPLQISEAVLNNSSQIEEDFSNRFNIIPSQDPTLLSKESINAHELINNNSINKSRINCSINRSRSQENNLEKLPIKGNKYLKVNNKSPNLIKNNNEKIVVQDDSQYNFKLNARHRFVPKGMSQIFNNCFSKNICSYNLDTEYYENTIYNHFVEDVAVNSNIFKPTVQNIKDTTGNIQKVNEKRNKDNADLIFGIDSLKNAKILGQVDCKFIAAIIQNDQKIHKSPDFFVLFDQHAVHERIRLETNLAYYFDDNNWKKVTIDEISLKSSKDEILYLHNHKDKFTQFGLEWTVINNSEIIVHAIPEAIRGKNPRPVEVIIESIKDLILEQIHAIKYLKGNVSLYPQSIMNPVFSEACRYAIKFGDHLSMKDCVELIAGLANCKTPFQCAHGRPVMAVMLELNNEKIEYKVNIENLKQFKNRMKK